jgi:hypothetical protein
LSTAWNVDCEYAGCRLKKLIDGIFENDCNIDNRNKVEIKVIQITLIIREGNTRMF